MTSEESKTDQRPLVSVLMACYNHEAYVISALESVAASDFKSIELIFIDDASQDNSYNLASEWFEKNKHRFVRTVCLQHEKNCGICATLNELLSLAKGAFVNFSASDDLVLSNGITGQVSFASKQKADFLFTDCQLMNQSGLLIAESALRYFGKSKEKLFKSPICLTVDIILNWQLPWNRFFARTESLKAIGGFNSSLIFEDRDLALRILTHGNFTFMPKSVTCYRYRSDHTTSLPRERVLRDFSVADINNFYRSSGLVKLILALIVFTYEEKYQHGGFVRNLFNCSARKLLRYVYRVIRKVHSMLIK